MMVAAPTFDELQQRFQSMNVDQQIALLASNLKAVAEFDPGLHALKARIDELAAIEQAELTCCSHEERHSAGSEVPEVSYRVVPHS